MESSLFGGRYNTQINKQWEQMGRRSQRYSWSCGGVRAVHGECGIESLMESISSTRTRFRSVIPEEGVTRERYLGVRDVLKEESFC